LGVVELLAKAGATQSLDDFESNRLQNVKRAIASLLGMNEVVGQRMMMRRWRDCLGARRDAASSYTRAAKRFLHGNLFKCFDGWRLDAKRDGKGKWMRALLWFVWRQLSGALGRLRKENCMYRVCRRVCRLVINDAICMAFMQWQRAAKDMKMEKMRQIVVRLLHEDLARVFGDWRYLCYAHSSRRSLCRRVCRKLILKGMALALEKWRVAAGEIKEDKMRKFMMRIRTSTYSMAMDHWLTVTREDIRVKALLRGAVTRMFQRMLSAAFEQWQQVASELQTEGAKMKRALLRMAQRHLVIMFQKWRHDAAQRRKHQGVIRRMLQRKLSMAFEKLQADAEATKTSTNHTNRAIGLLLLGDLARGFHTMKGFARRQRELRGAWGSWLTCLRNDARSQHDERMKLMFDECFSGGSAGWAHAMAGGASIMRVARRGERQLG